MKFKSKIFIVALFFCLIMSLGFVAAQDNTTLSGNDVKVNDYKDDNVKIYEENTNDLSSNSNDGNHYENDLNTVSNSKDQETIKDSEKTFDDLQATINASSSGDVIYLNGTTYVMTSQSNATISITTSNLIIDGGFADRAGVSTLDGSGLGKQLMNINANNITLRNIKFMNGGAITNVAGGAIQWAKNTRDGTVTDCVFINNTANAGGAINSACANTNISNCIFENNKGNMMAGAIQVIVGFSGTIFNCTFKRNSAINGGAIAATSALALNVENCSFIENNATNAGALNLMISGCNITDSVFENNTASKRGGAISSGQSSTKNSTITNCSFSQNTATDGGAVIVAKSNFAIENSTFSNNSAVSGGGLVVETDSTVNLFQSEFSHNTATDGGAVIVAKSNLVVDNSTFSNNSADCGGGLVVETDSTVNITQSEFVGNEGNIVINGADIENVTVDNATEEASDDNLIQVMPDMSKINITIDNYTYGDKGTINCVITDSAYYDSSIYVIINDEIYSALIDSEGKATIELPLLNAGNYSLNIIYNGTENYSRAYVPVNFTVNKIHVHIDTIAPEKTYGAPVEIDVTLNPAIDGVVYIVYNGTNYTADVTGGKGEFKILGLNAGNYTFNVIYDGNENYEGSAEVNVHVRKSSLILGVEVENITVGDIAYINVTLWYVKDIDGVVYIVYEGTNYTANVTGGKGTIEIPGLGIGDYNLTVIYDGDDNYNNNSAHARFSVTKIPVTMEANADNITVNETARINVVLNPAIDGVVYIVYEGNNYTANVTGGSGTIEIPNLDLGDYTFTVYYDGDENHTACSAEVNLTVKEPVDMDISYANITYGDVAYINVRLPLDAHGVAYIVYGGKNYTVNLTQGVGRIEIPDLNAGNYTFDVMYSGCEKYNATSAVINLTVYKNAIDIDLNADNITFGDIARINVVLYPAINGVVYIEYGGKNYTANVTAGEGTIEIPDLEIGDYTFTVIYDESENYNASSEVVALSVLKKDTNITVTVDNITLGESAFINVVLNPDAEGVVYIELNETIYTADLSGGKGTIVIPNLTPGTYDLRVIYNGSEIYNNASQEFQVIVHKHNSTMALNVTDVIYGETVSIFIKTDCPDSEVYVDINGKIYSTTLVDGEGVINIPGLNADRYLVDVSYVGNENYSSCDIPIIFTVAQLNTTTTANAATFVINYGGTYKAIVKSNNKGLAGVKVSFILNGKIIGSATTDSNGVATIKLTAAQLKSAGAGSRALTSLFAGNKNYKASSVTKKIKINKEATKFINVKSVKKSYKSTAKSMQLTATLKDSKNKVVKSQWVYFKVNNKKTYKVKTNSKGVAKLSLNAANIKACKINKRGNYKFTVTFKTTKVYNQATKKGTLKVLR